MSRLFGYECLSEVALEFVRLRCRKYARDTQIYIVGFYEKDHT